MTETHTTDAHANVDEDADEGGAGAKAGLFLGGAVIGLTAVVIIGLFVITAFASDGTNSEATDSAPTDGGTESSELSTSIDTPASVEVEVDVTATEFGFDPEPIVLATTSRVNLSNEGAVLHNFVIEGIDNFELVADAGQTESADIGLNAGEYVVYCSIPGHRAAGMETDLIVE
jgi:plastocyanin